MGTKYTEEWVRNKAKKAVNKKIKDLDKFNRDSNNKGYIGHVIEESVFEITPNSRKEYDIVESQIEIKTMPLKRNKNTKYVPKERLVLNLINFETEALSEFYQSSFYKKNKRMQILIYLHDFNQPKETYKIIGELFVELDQLPELQKIKDDWTIITNKIKNGLAHEISESDTKFLGACTKGTIASDRKQPFSSIMARQRAFSLKPPILRQLLLEKIIKLNQFKKYNYSNNLALLESEIMKYSNIPLTRLYEEHGLSITAKSVNSNLLKKILKVKKFEELPIVYSDSIIIKTIDLEGKKIPTESIQFPLFYPDEFDNFSWDESDFYNQLKNYSYLFIVIDCNNQKEKIISSSFIWSANNDELKEAQRVWEDTKYKFLNGIEFETKTNKKGIKKEFNNLIGSSTSWFCHVRPKAKNGNDRYTTQNGQSITKQCFWINRSYYTNLIKKI